eukprot:gene10764-13181_t
MAEKTYAFSEVQKHNSLGDLWIVYKDDVFDVTKFVEDHPGGEEVLKGNAGKDATQEFDDVGHSDTAIAKMKQFRIGRLEGAAPRKEVPKKSASTSTSSSSKSTTTAAKKEDGGLGLLKIPLIIIVLAILAFLFLGSDSVVEDLE